MILFLKAKNLKITPDGIDFFNKNKNLKKESFNKIIKSNFNEFEKQKRKTSELQKLKESIITIFNESNKNSLSTKQLSKTLKKKFRYALKEVKNNLLEKKLKEYPDIFQKNYSNNLWSLNHKINTESYNQSEIKNSEQISINKKFDFLEKYSRKQVQEKIEPQANYVHGAGTWGLQGIIEVSKDKNRDNIHEFVLFMTIGTQIAGHTFKEFITSEGILHWQSQPRQNHDSNTIKKLINHKSENIKISVFIRPQKIRRGRSRQKNKPSPFYNFIGELDFLSTDINKNNPVYFEWSIKDWNLDKYKQLPQQFKIENSVNLYNLDASTIQTSPTSENNDANILENEIKEKINNENNFAFTIDKIINSYTSKLQKEKIYNIINSEVINLLSKIPINASDRESLIEHKNEWVLNKKLFDIIIQKITAPRKKNLYLILSALIYASKESEKYFINIQNIIDWIAIYTKKHSKIKIKDVTIHNTLKYLHNLEVISKRIDGKYRLNELSKNLISDISNYKIIKFEKVSWTKKGARTKIRELIYGKEKINKEDLYTWLRSRYGDITSKDINRIIREQGILIEDEYNNFINSSLLNIDTNLITKNLINYSIDLVKSYGTKEKFELEIFMPIIRKNIEINNDSLLITYIKNISKQNPLKKFIKIKDEYLEIKNYEKLVNYSYTFCIVCDEKITSSESLHTLLIEQCNHIIQKSGYEINNNNKTHLNWIKQTIESDNINSSSTLNKLHNYIKIKRNNLIIKEL